MKAPAPKLSPPRQDRPSVGVVTPPRRDADRHGGFRAPETRLSNKGTHVASQVFTEARDRDVVPDRRNVPWSPENVLIDTVARLQRDLNDMRAEYRFFRTPGVPNVVPTPDMGHLRRLKYRGLRVRLAGNNTGRCLMPLCRDWDWWMH